MLLAWWHKTLTGPPPSATAVVGWWLQVEDLPRSRRRPSKHDRAPRKPGDPTKEFRRPVSFVLAGRSRGKLYVCLACCSSCLCTAA